MQSTPLIAGRKAIRSGASGKTKKTDARERIKNHLFHTNGKTGAKLAEIMAHACSGGTVELARVEVSPQSLENYLKEELIGRQPAADWNRENVAKRKAKLRIGR